MKSQPLRYILVGIAGLLLAGSLECRFDSSSMPICNPYQVETCTCSDGSQGVRSCTSNARAWTDCDCEGGGAVDAGADMRVDPVIDILPDSYTDLDEDADRDVGDMPVDLGEDRAEELIEEVPIDPVQDPVEDPTQDLVEEIQPDAVEDAVTDISLDPIDEDAGGPVECTPDNAETVCHGAPCVDGYCCDTDCDGLCMACDIIDHEGFCTFYSDGADPFDECGLCHVCDGDGDCRPADVGTDPKEDCLAEVASTCGLTGACDDKGACAFYDTDTECTDENLCTYADHCDGAGHCVGDEIECISDPETCGADRTCNGTEECDVSYPDEDVDCEDGHYCTMGDHCDGEGGCVPGSDSPCEEGWLCWEDEEPHCCEENAYTACGEGDDRYYFDSCGHALEVAELCAHPNGECVEDDCGCRNHWEGETCETCPSNWDPDADCGACLYGWGGTDCTVELCVLDVLESFDSALPDDWTIVDGSSDGVTWEWSDVEPTEWDWNPPPDFDGGFALCDSDAHPDNDLDERLVSPWYELRGCTGAILSFDHNFQKYRGIGSGYDRGRVILTVDDTDTNLVTYNEDSDGIDSEEFDLTSYLGGADRFQITFRYWTGENDWGWLIDNVSVVGTE